MSGDFAPRRLDAFRAEMARVLFAAAEGSAAAAPLASGDLGARPHRDEIEQAGVCPPVR